MAAMCDERMGRRKFVAMDAQAVLTPVTWQRSFFP